MKRLTKVMSVVLAFIMLMSMGIYSSAMPKFYYPVGDFDKDQEVTAADARMVLRAAVGLETLSEEEKLIADYDGDGEISAADARMVLRTAVDLEPVIYIDTLTGERFAYCKETNQFFSIDAEGYFNYTGQKYKDYDAIPEDTWYIYVKYGKAEYLYKPHIPAPPAPDDPQPFTPPDEPTPKYTEENDPYYWLPGEGTYPKYAGLYYKSNGVHCDYEDLEEGEPYYHYNSKGEFESLAKPWTTPQPDLWICQYCGKSTIGKGRYAACALGGCTRWMTEMECPYCHKTVPAHTCHTCPKEYQVDPSTIPEGHK